MGDCRPVDLVGGRTQPRCGIFLRNRWMCRHGSTCRSISRARRRRRRPTIRGGLGGRRRRTALDRPVRAAADAGRTAGRAQFLPSGPDQTEDTVHALLIDACFQATQRMLAVTPYFVPDAVLEAAMRLAARRGVKIDLCIPAEVESPSGGLRAQSIAACARAAGVSIHLLHAHESCQSRGVRSKHRTVRFAQPRLAQPAAQL